MATRNLLHKNKLTDLENWLKEKGYKIIATSRNPYEVLRAVKDKDTVIIYCKENSKEHLSVMGKDYNLIRLVLTNSWKSYVGCKSPPSQKIGGLKWQT